MKNETSRLFDFLYLQQQQFPRRDMLTAKENGRWIPHSTDEVVEIVNRLSAALLMLGLRPQKGGPEMQDKIAVISRNRPEWLMLDLAAQQIGVLLCPVYPTTHPSEMEFIFNDASVKYVFVSGEEMAQKVADIKNRVPSIIDIISFDSIQGYTYWKNLLTPVNAETIQQVKPISDTIKAEDCVTIIYTSGTTGVPKGVMLSHRNLVMNVLNATKTFPFPPMPTASALSFLPLNHIFERIASYIYISTAVSIYYAESLETIGENLKEVKPVLFTTVPRLLEKVYEKIMTKGAELKGIKRKLFFWSVSLAERYDNLQKGSLGYRISLAIANALVFSKWRAALGGNIKYIITGGAACQPRLLRIFNAARIPVYEGYGPTENSPVISVNCAIAGGMKFGTVGWVIEGQEVKIEQDGEICVKGPSVMMGYYKRPDLTAEVVVDGWLHTGDIGEMEAGGYLKITDRKKELFKTSGGKYVAPQPIENKLKESPFIEQVMVVGADRKFVAALIIPAVEHLQSWMKEQQLEFAGWSQALQHPRVLEKYDQEIARFNITFNHVEQVRKFRLLDVDWSVATGELTPKLSLKRKVILEKFKSAVEAIYQ